MLPTNLFQSLFQQEARADVFIRAGWGKDISHIGAHATALPPCQSVTTNATAKTHAITKRSRNPPKNYKAETGINPLSWSSADAIIGRNADAPDLMAKYLTTSRFNAKQLCACHAFVQQLRGKRSDAQPFPRKFILFVILITAAGVG